MAHLALIRAFLQPAATAAMHCQLERCTYPHTPILPFLLAQNLHISSKAISLIPRLSAYTTGNEARIEYVVMIQHTHRISSNARPGVYFLQDSVDPASNEVSFLNRAIVYEATCKSVN